MSANVRAWLIVLAMFLIVLGVAMLVAPDAEAGSLWAGWNWV